MYKKKNKKNPQILHKIQIEVIYEKPHSTQTNLFQEHLKYVITPFKSVFIHGSPEDNMYYNPLVCFSQSGEMKMRDSDNATLTSGSFLLNGCKQCSLEPHIHFMFKQSHIYL